MAIVELSYICEIWSSELARFFQPGRNHPTLIVEAHRGEVPRCIEGNSKPKRLSL